VHLETLNQIVHELSEQLCGRFLGKIFQLNPLTLVFDFGIREGNYLLISVEPKRPRLYLINRRLRDLEKQSVPHGPFAQVLRSILSGAELTSISTYENERVVRLSFTNHDETGAEQIITLLAQLTGRSANLLLLDQDDRITHALRTPRGSGQQIDEIYRAPSPQTGKPSPEKLIQRGSFPLLSQALDEYFLEVEREEAFSSRVQAVRERLRREIAQKEKLLTNLHRDLVAHGEAEQHKRLGDLLLANLTTATRDGQTVRLRDYYSDVGNEIQIEVDENTSLQDEAAHYFAKYTKAKRGKEEITRRLSAIEEELVGAKQKAAELDQAARRNDEAALLQLEGPAPTTSRVKKKDTVEKIPGVRRYRSSDGYEILVGRAAHTNDRLTFKVARPHDLWLHAADYPGSHVIVRNSSRKEIPQRTIFEAAALAAKFSQAGDDLKVDVHYAERKFLSKPKGGAPGLVRMSSFRTVTVTPAETVARI
jgi:predicted ribosome quality control (RQC) complex YloA/Tae2 family protein